MIGERTEKEEEAREANENDDDIDNALVIIGKNKRKKRNKGRNRGNAPPSKKQRQMTNDDSKVDPEAKNFEEVGNTEPKIAPKAMTQNYFSIFNTNSKFKNAPGKVLKKPRVKNVTASKKRKVNLLRGSKV